MVDLIFVNKEKGLYLFLFICGIMINCKKNRKEEIEYEEHIQTRC
jgi:hypothetical protein